MIIVVLALALLAFMVDKLFLGEAGAGPRPAAGSPPGPSAGTSDPALPSAAGPTPAAIPSGPSLADRLRDIAKSQDLKVDGARDAFTPSESWRPTPTTRPATTRPAVQRPKFDKTHKLMAVMAGPKGSAIVDGECLRVGDTLDGYTLVSVTERAAVFQSGDEQVQLTLSRPGDLKE